MNQNNLLINALLGQLRNNNPNAYNEVSSYMNSGKNPEDVLNSLLQSGRFTKQDIEKAKTQLNNYTKSNHKRF